ncbi:MAG: alpha/beta hydrolase [Planctomycetes bacterium]|nr:alpha/beta hydrolase [Planctomycetota bacterium]
MQRLTPLLLLLCCAASSAAAPINIVLFADEKDQPNITVHLPDAKVATGAAVIVCPGGGYGKLTMDSEGHDTAKWFARHGVAGITLQYRLPSKPYNDHKAPLADAHAAIRTVRKNAKAWGIDPQRVGILGFSAGGHLASTAATHFDETTRPDFAVLIYPAISLGKFGHGGVRRNLLGAKPTAELIAYYSNEKQVTDKTPPTFLAHANDDRSVAPENSVQFYLALRKARVPAELHIYQRGGHGMHYGKGYGIGNKPNGPAATWPDRCIAWMRARRLLGE